MVAFESLARFDGRSSVQTWLAGIAKNKIRALRRKSRPMLLADALESSEGEIDRFLVIESEGNILGCAALYTFPDESTAELACLAVNPFYRDGGRGERLLEFAEARARKAGFRTLFVLSTRTTHWFIERGFAEADISRLPGRKQSLYNYERGSKIFIKGI